MTLIGSVWLSLTHQGDLMDLIPIPADKADVPEWLKVQEERIATRTRDALVRIIGDAYELWVSSLTAAGNMAAFDGIVGEWELYVDDLMDELGRVYLSAGIQVWGTSPASRVAGEQILSEWIEVVNRQAVDYALARRVNVVSGIGENLSTKLQEMVSRSVLEGTSNDKLAAEIREVLEFSKVRADMVARTETAAAYNNGDWESMQALGEFGPARKYWIPTGDARAREWHTALAFEPSIPMDVPFDVDGEAMMFPQEPGSSGYNTVNCRCVAGYLYPGDVDPMSGELIGEDGLVPSEVGEGL